MTIQYIVILETVVGEIELSSRYVTGNVKGFSMVKDLTRHPCWRGLYACPEVHTPLMCSRLREAVNFHEAIFDNIPEGIFGL